MRNIFLQYSMHSRLHLVITFWLPFFSPISQFEATYILYAAFGENLIVYTSTPYTFSSKVMTLQLFIINHTVHVQIERWNEYTIVQLIVLIEIPSWNLEYDQKQRVQQEDLTFQILSITETGNARIHLSSVEAKLYSYLRLSLSLQPEKQAMNDVIVSSSILLRTLHCTNLQRCTYL